MSIELTLRSIAAHETFNKPCKQGSIDFVSCGARMPYFLPGRNCPNDGIWLREKLPAKRLPSLPVTILRGSHPFPSRTRKLSLAGPMVLHAKVCGRLGDRRHYSSAKARSSEWAFCVGRPIRDFIIGLRANRKMCLAARMQLASPGTVRWLYLDLNSYFASVEQQLRPELRAELFAVIPEKSKRRSA